MPRTSPAAASTSAAPTASASTPQNGQTTDVLDPELLLQALVALKRGDTSVRLPMTWTGIAGKIADAVNDVIDLSARMTGELERTSQSVGKEGNLNDRASIGPVMGFWSTKIRCVNALIDDLARPTTEMARVIGAVAKGDLSQSMALDVDGRPLQGQFMRSARTVNTMVDQLSSFASEVTRVAREVGTEGKLGGQATVQGVAGIWKDLTDNVNSMASNLTAQVRNIADVTTAVANGDLSKKITVDVKGEILELKNTINTMVDQLGSFASEVTRVARDVGTEGKLGGQAHVRGVAGTWKDLTDNVNLMANNLTDQVRNIAEVTTAVARGDLSKKITVEVRGEILELKDTINTMVDQLSSFASEVTRVAREVGTEGKLGGQARVVGVSGTWKDLTDNVNSMASNLTAQVRSIDEVIAAVAKGDLSKKIAVDVKGEILVLKNTINTMVDQLSSFASEVTRVAREVGTEGKLGGRADVQGVAGTWKDLTDNVNSMATNLTDQMRNIAEVTTAVAKGDLSKKITVDVKGEILELKNTINTMVDQLSSFASEVTRVAREVGTEGKLGGQAAVEGVAGTWKDLTDNVNLMANNLTGQVRNIAEVTTAVAKGDLSKKITVDVKGEILELKNTINTMVDQLSSFASEVTRVAREVGTEGKLGGQAAVEGVAGTWKDLTDNVNLMANNLTDQVRNIADVTTAVANGDLSKKITVDVKGEIWELKDTINTMVDQLGSFASEVTRVAREVGTEGKLGGQARVQGVAGIWKDLTDNVNLMANNLTGQVRNIAEVTTAVANGDLSKKITVDVQGEILELKNTINTMVDQLSSFASEVTRVAREVGTEGKLGGQAYVSGVAGIWKDLTDNVNMMAANLTGQVRNIAAVTTAVANGDLSKKITVDVRGEILELKDTINTMVDQLNSFASEVTRVAREVGTEGKLGGQAQVKGVSGTWKDLTDNVNLMAANLTGQVRGIAKVVTGVANGDLKQKLTLEAKGEIAALADTINGMIDTLATFADQVTTVARLVGVEGKLGGQASVPGAAGTWKALTDNVNQLAANLTTQVRAIAEVATAVTKGDLTREIRVDARGEVAVLKDNINEMIRNLRDTTQKNSEQDWLKTNLARFTRMLQGQRDLLAVSRLILSELAPLVSAQQGVFFVMNNSGQEPSLNLLASYGHREDMHQGGTRPQFRLGEGLVGQCATEKHRILISDVPPEYLQINSALGNAPPANLIILPVLFEGQVKAVIELASFQGFNATHETFLDQLTESIGIVINTIEANMRTEELLKQSQSLARELQSRQEELQKTNAELEEKARLLAEQNAEVERKNREVEQAKKALEEKATQLALTSKYKSEFLANMSHELRTPLNSLLILAHQLGENPEGNLSSRQVHFARTIHSAGSDLMALINDILDLSKIESGTVTIEYDEVLFSDLRDYVDRTFRHVADDRELAFEIEMDTGLPPMLSTDSKRLRQVLKNLLSNAFKFTARGSVSLQVKTANKGWTPEHSVLSRANRVVAFSVRDTGIGIPADKQRLIFEAFQQADGTTSRKYGGTGLGLSISREIARLLGGEIKLHSVAGKGSTFTLYLPDEHPTMSGRGMPLPGRMVVPPAGADLATTTADLVDSVLAPVARPAHIVLDDSESIQPGDTVVLIVENEPAFGEILVDIAQRAGLKTVVADRGGLVVPLALQHNPAAITLDLRLPDLSGVQVLERLKEHPETRDIPVHIISGVADGHDRVMSLGAASYWLKPVEPAALQGLLRRIAKRSMRRMLLVGGSEQQRAELSALVEPKGFGLAAADAGKAVNLISEGVDCVVLADDAMLAASSLFDSIEAQPEGHKPPVIVLTSKRLPRRQERQLRQSAQALTLRTATDVREVAQELETLLELLPPDEPELEPAPLAVRNGAAAEPASTEPPDTSVLAGRRVLVVDDDVRNIFALASFLERYELKVETAENGRNAIAKLESNDDIDVVLMDIMMPEMDGYDTMRAIRANERFSDLPIIALTARAMKGDREKCIDAGASDYIPKPVSPEQLLSRLCHWLKRYKGSKAGS